MIEVYWWAGSFDDSPEFFHLIDYNGRILYPDGVASSGVYNMKPVDEPLNLSIDGEVAFDEFGTNKADDNSEGSYEELIEYQKKHLAELKTEEKVITVSRENIFLDMINVVSFVQYMIEWKVKMKKFPPLLLMTNPWKLLVIL